jgi:hypothetical protein
MVSLNGRIGWNLEMAAAVVLPPLWMETRHRSPGLSLGGFAPITVIRARPDQCVNLA